MLHYHPTWVVFKRPRPSSSAVPPTSSTRHVSTPPPPHHPKDPGGGSFRSPFSPVGGVYDHLILVSEKEAASSRATDILKGAVTSSHRRLLSSVSREDLDKILFVVLEKLYFTISPSVFYICFKGFRAFDLYVLSQAVTLWGKLLSCPSSESRETHKKRLEEQVECLLRDVTDFR
ncbi:UNVERIFIED_CONTAM: hypothetical protein Sradi_5845400 [Sesamum radiatum]|uniref:Uncharacterized protein n=1 Tax=Sesamum radiatum TaxID=300843 RepID=A0AAW2KQ72_SESRA